ncbi:MAG TPA: hypothetical protein VKX25_11815 [Bryobacteraceae bacterium]|jgi:uncharacterized membrane protein (UPF0136 family)|nr:hypothetical protein [Bryobacteraceae bacterium]
MSAQLLRVVYVCEFLVALIAIFSAWSEIGGQATLDLMHWAFKLVFGAGLAAAVVAYSAALVKDEALWTMRTARWLTVIVMLLCAMGVVTYFYAQQVEAGDSDETAPMHHAVSSSFWTS